MNSQTINNTSKDEAGDASWLRDRITGFVDADSRLMIQQFCFGYIRTNTTTVYEDNPNEQSSGGAKNFKVRLRFQQSNWMQKTIQFKRITTDNRRFCSRRIHNESENLQTSRSGRISKVRLDVGEVSRTGNTPLQDVGVWGSVDIISAASSCTKNIDSVRNMLPTTEYLRVEQTQRTAELERCHVDKLSTQRSKREITTHKEGTNGSLHSDETVVTVCSICVMFDTDVQVFDRHVTIHINRDLSRHREHHHRK